MKLNPILLSKDVLLFKNVLKDADKTHKFVLESKTNGDHYLGNWEDWRPWGQYSKFEPSADLSWQTSDSEGAAIMRECIDIFFDVLKIYKEQFMNEQYFDLHGFDKDIPTTLEELNASKWLTNDKAFSMGDFVILESENTEDTRKLSMDYHQDRRFWFGGVPHIFNFNIYTNDDYEGGAIRFINTHDAERKTYFDRDTQKEEEYLLVTDFFEYKMEAGDAMLFRTDHYHAVTPVDGHKFYIRQFLSSKLPKEYWDAKASFDNDEDFEAFIKVKEKEGFESRESMILFNSPEEITINSPSYASWHGKLVPCVLQK